MKSYISKKFPLQTRKTVRTFSQRCSGVSMFPSQIAYRVAQQAESNLNASLPDTAAGCHPGCGLFRMTSGSARTIPRQVDLPLLEHRRVKEGNLYVITR